MRTPAVKPDGKFHIHLVVSDMKASIDFYVTVLGFYYDHGVPEVAWLTLGNIMLTLSPGDPEPALSTYFGWSVDSMEELKGLYAKLYARHQRITAEPDIDAERAYFFLYDPDDYPIAFTYCPLEGEQG